MLVTLVGFMHTDLKQGWSFPGRWMVIDRGHGGGRPADLLCTCNSNEHAHGLLQGLYCLTGRRAIARTTGALMADTTHP